MDIQFPALIYNILFPGIKPDLLFLHVAKHPHSKRPRLSDLYSSTNAATHQQPVCDVLYNVVNR